MWARRRSAEVLAQKFQTPLRPLARIVALTGLSVASSTPRAAALMMACSQVTILISDEKKKNIIEFFTFYQALIGCGHFPVFPLILCPVAVRKYSQTRCVLGFSGGKFLITQFFPYCKFVSSKEKTKGKDIFFKYLSRLDKPCAIGTHEKIFCFHNCVQFGSSNWLCPSF